MTKKRRSWIKVEACTLPTVEQPRRLAEFEDLFRASLRDVETPGPGAAQFRLVGGLNLFAQVKDLTDRESQCCSFFDFTLTEGAVGEGGGDRVVDLGIGVPAEHQPILAALVEHARAAQLGGVAR